MQRLCVGFGLRLPLGCQAWTPDQCAFDRQNDWRRGDRVGHPDNSMEPNLALPLHAGPIRFRTSFDGRLKYLKDRLKDRCKRPI